MWAIVVMDRKNRISKTYSKTFPTKSLGKAVDYANELYNGKAERGKTLSIFIEKR